MEETTPVFLERSSRPTRGKRITKLVDEELEADEEFWGQDALKEAAEDVEYETEEDIADVFDSDFDEDEANEEEGEAEAEVERVKKKRLLPPGSKPIRKDKKSTDALKTKGLDVIEAAVVAALQSKDDEPAPVWTTPKSKQAQEEADYEGFFDEGEKAVRKSTRTVVVVRQAEREALRAAMEATTIKPVKRKREGERRITQEDMLLEAAQTEILNRQHLEMMLAREEEVKQKAIVHKTVYSGPKIRFYSRDGKNFLEFMGSVTESQELFGRTKQSYKRPQVCAVTGLPAKYIDPLTGLPYATKEAFKMIRDRVSEDDDTLRDGTPGRKLRSARKSNGRRLLTVSRKARRPAAASFGDSHGKLVGGADARVVISYGGMSKREEVQRPHDVVVVGEASPSEKMAMEDTTSLPWLHDGGWIPSEEGVRTQRLEFTADTGIIDEAATASLLQARRRSEPLWVDIPPPREGPNEDDFLLDDLENLNFGPILASPHRLDTHFHQHEDELDIAAAADQPPAVEAMFPLNELPMPSEFGTNA